MTLLVTGFIIALIGVLIGNLVVTVVGGVVVAAASSYSFFAGAGRRRP
jgi:hypothetical protein